VQAAQQFGQEDDITVVTLRRSDPAVAAESLTAAEEATSA